MYVKQTLLGLIYGLRFKQCCGPCGVIPGAVLSHRNGFIEICCVGCPFSFGDSPHKLVQVRSDATVNEYGSLLNRAH